MIKKLAIMAAAACVWTFATGDSAEAQHPRHFHGGNRSAFAISIGNGFSGFSYSRGFPGYYGGFARPVPIGGFYGGYRAVPYYRGYYARPYYGGYRGGHCRHW